MWDSQDCGTWEKLRKTLQHFVKFCIRNGTEAGTTMERGGNQKYGKRELQTPILPLN